MKGLLIFASVIALTYAEAPLSGGYSYPNRGSSSGIRHSDAIEVSSGGSDGGVNADNYVPQVYKHVYIHAAPDEAPEEQNRVIRVPGGDKHVNIIFVKTPAQSSQAQTEVILPDQDEHKNLVYVLLKKNEAENNIKITRPQAKRPSKPEVNFIRYADAAPAPQPQQPAPVYGTPADVPAPEPVRVRVPSGLYGTPADVPAPVRVPSGLYGTPSF